MAIDSNSWSGLLTRAGTPEPVLVRLNAELQRALTGTAAPFAAFIRSETDKYAQVIRRAAITSES